MAALSQEKIDLIKEVYKRIGTYSGTAKEVGCSPATVKKYVVGASQTKVADKPKREPTKFVGEIISAYSNNLKDFANWADMCNLSKEEFAEVMLFGEEI